MERNYNELLEKIIYRFLKSNYIMRGGFEIISLEKNETNLVVKYKYHETRRGIWKKKDYLTTVETISVWDLIVYQHYYTL